MSLEDHPTIKRLRARNAHLDALPENAAPLPSDWLRQLALDSGADDAGLVEISRPALEPQRAEILHRYPWTQTLLSFVVRMTREPVRSTARSIANLEFHTSGAHVDEVARRIVLALEGRGIRAVNPPMGFPMEMYHFPGNSVWVVSHKPIAVAAGLGHMGIHRNLIHPRFGNFVLLGTVLIDAIATDYGAPLDYNPCLECKLCVAVCPVGAIAPDGKFNFGACFTHNYREFMGGFVDWVEQIADSRNGLDYRRRVAEPETASMWQSLSHGANYKSAYCMAVCPAGEDVIGPYFADRKRHVQEIVRPLQEKAEPVYVIAGSDAEASAGKWQNKTIRHAGNALRPRSIDALLRLMPFAFQPNQSRGLNATYHFKFTGAEERLATIVIRDRTLTILEGHVGEPQLQVTADSRTWLDFLAKESNLAWAFVRGKVRLKGSPRLLLAFGKCFPSAGVRHRRAVITSPPSRLNVEPWSYAQNDAATGKIRWSGVLELAEARTVTHDVKTFRFVNPAGGPIPFAHLPGQFLTLNIEPHGIPTCRSYTIASSPTRTDAIEITVKRAAHGLVSRWLHDELQPGARINVRAPSGTFVFTGEEAQSIVLIGGGVGITPLMSVVRWLADRHWPGDIHLLLAFRHPRDYLFRDELEELRARISGLHLTVTMSSADNERWPGRRGRIDESLLVAAVPDLCAQRIHLCGPAPMMENVRDILRGLGVPRTQVRTEAFGSIKRDPTAKVASGGAVVGRVKFQRSQLVRPVAQGTTILEAAEEAGINIENACRSGTCGSCRVRLLAGRVHMPVDDALAEDEKTEGQILACQAEPEGDVEVEA